MCELDSMDCALANEQRADAEDSLELLSLAVLSVSEVIHQRFQYSPEGAAMLRNEASFRSLLKFVSADEKIKDKRTVDSLLFNLLICKRNPTAIISFLEKIEIDIPPAIMEMR